MKTLKISNELHEKLKEYCKKYNLKMNLWTETLIKNNLK